MNTFLAFDPASSRHDPFVSLQVNMEMALRESRRDFNNFACFLGKSRLKSEDILAFVSRLRRFISLESETDEDISIIRYGTELLYVCCPHIEETESAAFYLINGVNSLPEHVLEGTGLTY